MLIKEIHTNFEALEYKIYENEEGESMVSDKFDFNAGILSIRDIFGKITKIYLKWGLQKHDREYRKKFTKAYMSMFNSQGGPDSLCFLHEILDAAQENHPHLWVNGEKYVFSNDVTGAATKLT